MLRGGEGPVQAGFGYSHTMAQKNSAAIANEQSGEQGACETLHRGVCNQLSPGSSNLMVML